MTAEEKEKLFAELGELTYKRVYLQKDLNDNARRANEIGTLIEKAEKDGK